MNSTMNDAYFDSYTIYVLKLRDLLDFALQSRERRRERETHDEFDSRVDVDQEYLYSNYFTLT